MFARITPIPSDLPLMKKGKNRESGDKVVSNNRNAKQRADEPTNL